MLHFGYNLTKSPFLGKRKPKATRSVPLVFYKEPDGQEIMRLTELTITYSCIIQAFGLNVNGYACLTKPCRMQLKMIRCRCSSLMARPPTYWKVPNSGVKLAIKSSAASFGNRSGRKLTSGSLKYSDRGST